jgi:hypothetical protein
MGDWLRIERPAEFSAALLEKLKAHHSIAT